jgi:hypothetical protein
MRFIHILRCPVEEIKIDNRTLARCGTLSTGLAEGFFDVGHFPKDQKSNRQSHLPGYAAWDIHPLMKPE